MSDRTAHRHECRCGKPIHDGAHLCPSHVAKVRGDLLKIADRWADLEAALTSSEKVTSEGAKPKRSTSTGLAINEAVSKARADCTSIVWYALQVIRDVCDTAGRDFAPPRTDDTGEMARWVATWHLVTITAKVEQEVAERIAGDLIDAESATFNALDPVRWVNVNLACDDHGTTELGERVPCTGTMRARVGRGVLPDLVCSVDPGHTISPAQWERAQWRRTRDLDEEGMRRLVRRIAT